MKRNLFIGMILLVGAGWLTSCDKTPSYTQLKKNQEKALNKFISQQGFEVLNKYPSNGRFKDNQFYLTEKGVYINVVDSGNGTRPQKGKTVVLMRCSIQDFFQVDTPRTINFFTNGTRPFEFVFGEAANIVNENERMNNVYTNFFSTGIEDALTYVGDGSIVKLIVPFQEGSTYQRSKSIPFYYDKVTFRFY